MKKLIVLSVVALFGLVSASAQVAKFQAMFLFQFAKNTSWPQEDNNRTFVFTIVGDAPVAQELRLLASNKAIGNRKIEVVEMSNVAELQETDVVYLGKTKNASIAKLAKNQADSKTLIVSGSGGMCANGAGIAFTGEGNRLNYEICEKNIQKSGLRVTPKLVALGKKVKY